MYAHIDMNSYFASVEQQANPHWRGRPLGVCAYLHKNGCVIAASIEAKKKGAKVGMSLEECRQVCPDMVFVQNDPPKYRAVTSRVFALLHELTDKVEHYSIDEAFLDLAGWYRDPAEAAWALCRTRLRIQAEVGDWLKCSVGIAPSKFLAKLASDLEKPNGLVILTPENLDQTLSSLEVEEAWGIGPRVRRRLNRLGIFTLMDLKRYPVANLMRVLGKAGWVWHERLHGRDVDRFEQTGERPPKSIGHSFCVPRRATRENTILPIMLRLTERAGRRLRSFGLLARSMSIAVSCHPEGVRRAEGSGSFGYGPDSSTSLGMTGSVAFSEPANDIFSLADGATRLLEAMWDGKHTVSFLAVTLTDFVPPSGQLRFPLPEGEHEGVGGTVGEGERRQKTSCAVDAIRDRYGEESIVFASMLGLSRDYAPDRIGFRKTEGVDVA